MINFDEIKEIELTNFQGGNGTIKARIFSDGKVKIMRLTLAKGVSIGMHTHTNNYEIAYVTKGVATYIIEGVEEVVNPGSSHYCPMGKSHYLVNKYDEELEVICFVPLA